MVWLIVAAVLGVVEIVTVTLAFGLVAIAALIAAAAGAAGAGASLQFGAFVVACATGLGLARPLAMRHVRQSPLPRPAAAALLGRTAVVVEEVGAHGGRVRIGTDLWPARSYDETLTIPAGSLVEVLHIENATALVYPRV
jgi:membrane protein implicated in regulation of membrane protease activity